MVDLHGKVALVTGGSRGIGRAIAAAFIERGAHVMVTARTDQHLSSARAVIDGGGGSPSGERGRFEAIVADVRDYDQVQQAVAATVDAFGGIDILVNNAGLGIFSEVASLTVEQWREIIDTNLTGVFHCCHATIPQLKRRGGGWIINISSLAGKNAFPGAAAYCASKSGLNAFSEALMQEVRYDDIRVSYVMPGSVRTEFGGSSDGEEADWKLTPEDVAQVVIDLVLHDPRSLPSRVELRPAKPRKR